MKDNFTNSKYFLEFKTEKDLCEKYFETFLNSTAYLQTVKLNIDDYKEKIRETLL